MPTKCPVCEADNTEFAHFCSNCAAPLRFAVERSVSQTETLETPPEELTRGTIIAERYEIIEALGRGGMGQVYRVYDKKIEGEVALKIIKPEISSNKKTIERFRNELKLAREISHRNICRMYDLNEENGTSFITMEYVPGENLKSFIRRSELLSIGKTIAIAKQICEGLAEAHKQKVIHRDLKSSNIMIDKEGNVRIMDFGIARSLGSKEITDSGMRIGTPEYMSPEQADAKETDHRSDIYSFGIILYEMLTGRLPFEGDTSSIIVARHKRETPENPKSLNSQIPDALNRLVLKCLEKTAEQRYQNAEIILHELEDIEEGITTIEKEIPKRKPITAKEITVSLSLKKLLIPALVIVALVVLLFLSIYLTKAPPAEKNKFNHKQITYVGNAYNPAISPDGKFMAFVAREPPSTQKIMIQDMVSGHSLEAFQAHRCRNLLWTPDSAEISFWAEMKDASAGAFIVPRLGGSARLLEASEKLAWSPDGSEYATCSEYSKDIVISNRATGVSTSIPLLWPFQWIEDIDWSPEGKFLCVLTSDEDDRYAIWSVSIDGTHQNMVFDEEIYDIGSPRWSPHGNAIYFTRVGEQHHELWKTRISPETGKPIKSPSLVLDGLSTGKDLTITNNGNQLLYAQEIQYSNIWLASIVETGEAESVKVKQITTGTFFDSCPNISPDGKLVAFTRGVGKKHNVYVMPITGGTAQQISFLDSFNFYPSWSPDGIEIAFISAKGGKARVWKVNARGGAPHQFQNTIASANSYQVSWAPGSNILYQTTGNQNFHMLNPKTGKEIPLWIDESVSSVHNAHYSPDGKKVAAFLERASIQSGISIFDLEDESQIDLDGGSFDPIAWSSDSEWIYVSDFESDDVRILKIFLRSGGSELVFALSPSPLRGRAILYQVRMSPDEKHFVFPANRSQSDVWMIENFDPEIE
ncbi:MAG: protein kinase [Candidatus Aminicenantes bacterium]|nr:MAG: protein kinase [Candidatus Aminicenantes bacterium]